MAARSVWGSRRGPGRTTPPELDPAVGGYDFDAGLVGKLAYEGLFDYRRVGARRARGSSHRSPAMCRTPWMRADDT